MHRRYDHVSIPIEIIRTLVCVAETGSFSKAGGALGLSQPAITAQMKRLEMIVGSPVFDRTVGGAALTPRGAIALVHARKVLREIDQILSLGGAVSAVQPIRLGLSTLYAEHFLKMFDAESFSPHVSFFCTHSREIEKRFEDGYLDIVCLLDPPESVGAVSRDWSEDFVWVRSRHFVLSPGTPVPIITWLGLRQEQPAIEALEKSGAPYRVVFTSYDYGVRAAAVAAGIGLMAMPERFVKPPLTVARDYYLPKLKSERAGVRVRDGFPENKAERIVATLAMLASNAQKSEQNGEVSTPRLVG